MFERAKDLNMLRNFRKGIKSTEVTYKGVDLFVEYKIANDSFDHEFGTEHLPDYPEIHSVMCDPQDITEMMTDSQIEDIQNLIMKEW